jgi:2-amino-4-hydroxy-6-hydroxymethyldihydropteridine diphosphokinase
MRHLCYGRSQVLKLPGVTGPTLESRIYQTAPVGPGSGTDAFLNAVIEVEFEGQPIVLLEGLQEIEAALGRPSKRPRNAPRTLDLDILYVGNLALTNEEVVIPHPRLHLRRFVLQPLADIRPQLVLPGRHQTVAELLRAVENDEGVAVWSETWDEGKARRS